MRFGGGIRFAVWEEWFGKDVAEVVAGEGMWPVAPASCRGGVCGGLERARRAVCRLPVLGFPLWEGRRRGFRGLRRSGDLAERFAGDGGGQAAWERCSGAGGSYTAPTTSSGQPSGEAARCPSGPVS